MHTTLYHAAKSTRGNTTRIVADSLESMAQEGRLAMGNLNILLKDMFKGNGKKDALRSQNR